MSVPRIVITSYPDDGSAAVLRTFHVNARLTNTDYYEMDGRPFNIGREEPSEELQWFINSLHAIDGIESIRIKTYEFDLTIGYAFSWNDILPRVIALLEEFLHWENTPQIEPVEHHYSPEICTHHPNHARAVEARLAKRENFEF